MIIIHSNLNPEGWNVKIGDCKKIIAMLYDIIVGCK
jgi:hypothetical protein